MRKNIMLAMVFVLATTAPALAGGKEGTIGAGVEAGLNPFTTGASMNYDAGRFHFGGFLGFFDGGDEDDTDYTFGARFYYHVHETSLSDFGVGGMIGFYSQDQPMDAERATLLFFEPGVQFRAFVANNVALSFTAGISFALVDADGAAIGGNLTGLAGIHYYFFK
jgi:hypothetical protein